MKLGTDADEKIYNALKLEFETNFWHWTGSGNFNPLKSDRWKDGWLNSGYLNEGYALYWCWKRILKKRYLQEFLHQISENFPEDQVISIPVSCMEPQELYNQINEFINKHLNKYGQFKYTGNRGER